MTLLRQLIIVIAILFALLFAGSMVINIHNARSYLNNQLHNISQDTATSLGLSLSPHMAKGEMSIIESKLDAISDSGYYREVVLTDNDGKSLIERIQPITIKGVPAWFVDWVSLETPRGEALLMAGWKKAGKVRVSANPGYAYSTLWNNSVAAFWWFLGFSGFSLFLGVVALRYLLRPLRAVEAQAKAICDRDYTVQSQIPWTLELRNVVTAMNMMSTKVKEMFKDQADAMERLRASTYVDALTGLANRQYFDMQLRQMTKSRTSTATSALIFIELHDFGTFNERKGYKAGVELMCGCGALIEEVCRGIPNLQHFAARMSGANFAIMAQNIAPDDALSLANKLGNSLIKLKERGLTDTDNVGHIGAAIHYGQAAEQLLSEADIALRTAQVNGPNAVHMTNTQVIDESGTSSHWTVSHWMEVLGDVLAERRIVLYRQPCISCKDDTKIVHYETLLRIYGDDGKLIPANTVIPMAKHLHLTQNIDRHVIVETLKRLGRPENANVVMAVNLFPSSIQDSGFVSWLCDNLREHADVAPRITFEVAEHGVTDTLDALRGWLKWISETGAKTGIDQVGKGLKSFNYLSELKLDYIKIDGSYSRGIHENKDHQFFIDSLVKFAHGLNIQVIAESVETLEERNALKNLRVDAVKGYGVGQPAKWD